MFYDDLTAALGYKESPLFREDEGEGLVTLSDRHWIAARDERAALRSGTGMVERVKGRPKARAAQQSARWSRRADRLD